MTTKDTKVFLTAQLNLKNFKEIPGLFFSFTPQFSSLFQNSFFIDPENLILNHFDKKTLG